jgi:mono/diheme cytochrome c family protein
MSRLSWQGLVGAMDWKLALRRCAAIGFSGGSLFLGQMILTAASGEQARSAPKTIPESNFYRDQIHPLLAAHCQACHNSEVKKGGLDLSTPEALLKGGDSGRAIVGGSAKTSLLYKLVAHEQEPTMPYKMDKLPNAAIAQLAVWINAGAQFDTAESSGRVAAGGSANLSLQTGGLGGDQAGGRLFTEKVRPVLELQCLNCHGGKFKQAGLSMVSRDTLLKGSDNGPVVIAGNAANSLLVKKLKHEHEPGMPYKAPKLAEDVIAQIVAWINAGAPYYGTLKLPAVVTQGVTLRHGSDHWAYQVPRRPAVPAVKNRGWVRNPIDAFVAAEHEKRGLAPLAEADPRTLLRRLYLDLVGLPPTVDEMKAFLGDRSKDAYEKAVDKLLASPRYGERWGRHWMDIWRYSDPTHQGTGLERVDYSATHIWRWRDWIIESLNADKGYDRMIMEMLAGDEIAPTDPQTLRATGYLARSWYRFNRNVWMQDIVDYTAAGFLGVTLKCARCHDHKYDPIAQEEYYKFRAFFEPYDVRTDRVPGQLDVSRDGDGLPRAFDGEPKEASKESPFLPAIFPQTYRFIRGDEKNPDTEHPLAPGVPEALGKGNGIEIKPVELPLEAYYPDMRAFVHKDLLAKARQDISKAEGALDRARVALSLTENQVATSLSTTSNVVGAETNAHPNQGSPAATETGVAFEKDIKPVFEKHCITCHKSGNARSGLAVDSLGAILEGGNINGPAIVPRNSKQSAIIQYIRGEKKPRMPLAGRLVPEEQINLISRWIDEMPQDDPQVARRKALTEVAVGEKTVAWARANLTALEARIAAEKAKYANPPDPEAEKLAQAARKTERQAGLLRAEVDLVRAQDKLTEALAGPVPEDAKADKEREAKIATARKQLQAAQTALTQPTEGFTPIGKLHPKTSSGRRLALAQWIANQENPLTARVAINHMWGRHFGKLLVPTPSNFGLSGKPPTHPALLDWLATELVDKNWKMKSIHRLMVTSSTYRMRSSTADPKNSNLAVDADNRYLWRMNSRRIEAEAVRDSLLQVAGQLDTTLMGGPELDETRDQDFYRRSIYFRHSSESQVVFLKLFDAATPEECYERNESIVPQQALALANSRLSYNLARVLTHRLTSRANSPDAFIATAFETVLGRPPSATELTESKQFLTEQAQFYRQPGTVTPPPLRKEGDAPPATDPDLRAEESFVHVLFNRNEFVTIR